MFRRMVALILLFATTTACNMWSKPPKGWSGATGGEQIENLFWHDVLAKDWKEVDRHLASTFSATGPAGIADRAAYLKSLQDAGIIEATLSDCSVQTNGGDMIVACKLHARTAKVPDATYATLSVWQQLKKGWVMVAHSHTLLASK